MSPWRNGHDLHNEGEIVTIDPPIETHNARPIHRYSGRCEQSSAICGNQNTSKTAVPPCL